MLRRIVFYNFYVAYRVDRWVKGRFTPLGSLILSVALACAVFGMNIRTTIAFQLLSLSVSLLLLSMLSALFFRCRLSAARSLPRFAIAQEPVRYQVEVRNDSKQLQRGLEISETVDTAIPTAQEFCAERVPDAGTWTRLERRAGYPHWVGLIKRLRGARSRAKALPELAPDAYARIELELTPLRRGRFQLTPMRITQLDPFGMFRASSSVGKTEQLLVLPPRVDVLAMHQELPAGGRGMGMGLSVTEGYGVGEEFAGLREYRPGDSTRHIDWKRWARMGTPIVKEFQDLGAQRMGLLLDTAVPESVKAHGFEEAVSVAASLALRNCADVTPVDCVFIGTQRYATGASRDDAAAGGLLEALACAKPAQAKSVSVQAQTVLAQAYEFSGCVLVLLDWDAARQALVTELAMQGVSVRVLVIAEVDVVTDSSPGVMATHPEHFCLLPPAKIRAQIARRVEDARWDRESVSAHA